MKRNLLAALAVLSLLAMAGCTAAKSSSGNASVEREVAALRAEVAALKDEKRMAELRGENGGEIERLRSEVDRLNQGLGSGGADNAELLRRLDQLNARLDRLEGQGGSTARPAASGASKAPEYASSSASGLFENGKILFEKKEYKEAITKFNAYLAAEPAGAQADAAQFFIGESLYLQKQYEEAILAYQKVVHGFPKSSQVPTSLLRQGISFQAIGDKGSAAHLYQKVAADYPKSYAATVAKKRLKEM